LHLLVEYGNTKTLVFFSVFVVFSPTQTTFFMKSLNPLWLSLVLLTLFLFSCQSGPKNIERADFVRFYDAYDLKGSFVLFDEQNQTYTVYNPGQLQKPFTPASTFKICNSLIGIETGVIADADFLMPWDSVVRWNENWNRDHDLRSAYRYSTVWYYQELARRVGGQRMKHWLDTLAFGNADTTGGIDQFWLNGHLKISPMQQIEFLRKLHHNELPFSQRTVDIVKDIMVMKDTLGFTVRAKTGWGNQDNEDIGWYVGYITRGNKVWYFANCVQSQKPGDDFWQARIDILYMILGDLNWFDEEKTEKAE